MNWLECTRTLLLDLCEVDPEDTTFFIPHFSGSDPLESSVARFGIINPPLVQVRSGTKAVPVLGRRRLTAARNLGVSRVSVRMAPEDMSEQEGFILAFWDNIACRSFDGACTAFVVKRLLELFPRNQVARDFLPVLRVPEHGPRLERLRAIGNLEFSVLAALAAGRIHEKTAWLLAMVDIHERSALLALCQHLGLNANKAAEVVESLFDLSVSHETPLQAFLEQEDVRKLFSDAECSTQQRADRFRDLLRSTRFPELVTREQEFHSTLSAVRGSSRITVQPTPGFESQACTVTVRCRSVDEAARMVSLVQNDS